MSADALSGVLLQTRRGKVGEWRRQSERRPRSSLGGDLTKFADPAAQTAARSGSSWGILRVKLGFAVVTAVATVEGRPWRRWRDGRGDGVPQVGRRFASTWRTERASLARFAAQLETRGAFGCDLALLGLVVVRRQIGRRNRAIDW